MPNNNYVCPKCKFYYDTPNHELGCAAERASNGPAELSRVLGQIPKIDPEENWEHYREELTKDGELDLQRVKELAAQFEWACVNNAALLQELPQNAFSKPHTHASWVAQAVHEAYIDEKMYEVEEIIQIVDAGGFMGETIGQTIRDYFGYDEWKEVNGNGA